VYFNRIFIRFVQLPV